MAGGLARADAETARERARADAAETARDQARAEVEAQTKIWCVKFATQLRLSHRLTPHHVSFACIL